MPDSEPVQSGRQDGHSSLLLLLLAAVPVRCLWARLVRWLGLVPVGCCTTTADTTIHALLRGIHLSSLVPPSFPSLRLLLLLLLSPLPPPTIWPCSVLLLLFPLLLSCRLHVSIGELGIACCLLVSLAVRVSAARHTPTPRPPALRSPPTTTATTTDDDAPRRPPLSPPTAETLTSLLAASHAALRPDSRSASAGRSFFPSTSA